MARLSRVLAAKLRAVLGREGRVAVSRVPAPPRILAPGERAALGRLRAASRREDWLRGRGALKAILSAEGADPDTSRLAFPNPRYSVTHAGGVAVAVSSEARGTGVDLEVRAPSESVARRFLSPREFRGARGRSAWQRLWTVKEACFKADPSNGGLAMTSYEADDPRARAGLARKPSTGARFRYVSLRALGGWLSVAVRSEG